MPRSRSLGARTAFHRTPARIRSESLDHVGSWRLLGVLGEGTWTRVHRACPANRETPGDGDYAVKCIKREFESDPLVLGLLEREVAVSSDVQHVNVVSVLAHQLSAPPLYLVTPWLAGAPLDCVIRQRGALNTPHALWIARQTAEGLRALHERGWRHGDVKPHNLFVAVSGHVTLLDLGFAERLAAPRRRDYVMGSPAYGPPELFQATTRCDAASDVYSLGVTLFEMLTAHRPFTADTWETLAAAHRQEAPSDPRRFTPQLPTAVSQLIQRMLAKHPLRRPTINELIAQLQQLEIETLDERTAA